MLFMNFFSSNANKDNQDSKKVEVVTPTLSRTVIVKDEERLKKFMVEQINQRDQIMKEISQVSTSAK